MGSWSDDGLWCGGSWWDRDREVACGGLRVSSRLVQTLFPSDFPACVGAWRGLAIGRRGGSFFCSLPNRWEEEGAGARPRRVWGCQGCAGEGGCAWTECGVSRALGGQLPSPNMPWSRLHGFGLGLVAFRPLECHPRFKGVLANPRTSCPQPLRGVPGISRCCCRRASRPNSGALSLCLDT